MGHNPTRSQAQLKALQSIAAAKQAKEVERAEKRLAPNAEKRLAPNFERDQRIVSDCMAGMTQRQLSERYGICQPSIARILKKAGFKYEPERLAITYSRAKALTWTPEMIASLDQSRAKGLSIKKAAAIIGVGLNQVVVKSRQRGLTKGKSA